MDPRLRRPQGAFQLNQAAPFNFVAFRTEGTQSENVVFICKPQQLVPFLRRQYAGDLALNEENRAFFADREQIEG